MTQSQNCFSPDSGLLSSDSFFLIKDYYPFGSTLREYNAGSVESNKFKYQGKERDQETGYDDFGGRLFDSQIARSLQVDPMREKFLTMSSYVSMGNNPIMIIDPDGKEIWIVYQVKNEDGTSTDRKAQYKGGKLYNEDGSDYSGKNEYVSKVQADLNQLAKDDEVLSDRISILDGSKNIHTIKMTENPEDGNQNTPKSKIADKMGIPTGSNTDYNPDKDTNVRGDKRAPRVGLAHELLGHGYDSDQGKSDYSNTDNGIPMYEVSAVNVENVARAAAGDPKKTTYSGKQIPKNLLNSTPKKKESK